VSEKWQRSPRISVLVGIEAGSGVLKERSIFIIEPFGLGELMAFVRVALGLCLAFLVCVSASADVARELEDAAKLRDAQRVRFVGQQQPVERLERLATTPCVGGLAGTYPCQDIDLVTFMPLSSIGGGSGNDVWGWTDPTTGREYAIMGRTSGTSFIDITDAENPVYLGNLPPHGANSSWRDIKVHADHAYIVSEAAGHGVQVFDLTQLRSVTTPPMTFAETSHYGNIGSSHNIAINEDTGFAYVVGATDCSGGPHFVDLANPAAPVFAGCHIETLYTHDTQCVVYAGPDPDHAGREICVNSNTSRINVIDVTDHAASFLISETTYTGTGYIHQGWLTEDQRYYIQGDELDEQNFGHNTRSRIFDMTDLDAPVLIGTHDHATAAIDHNLYTHNGYAYMANYRAGLRIMDMSDIANGNISEIAFFDIYPSSDSASFNGAWSVYPYFDSGNVVISGIEQGLFIVRPNLGPSFQLDVSPNVAEICDPGSDSVNVSLTDRNGYIGSVSMTTSGAPAGVTPSFDIDPVTVPGSSLLSLDTAGVAPGTYSITVTADDGSTSQNRIVQLHTANQIPGQPSLTLPPNGAVDVSRQPSLEWAASAQAMDYTVEISTDASFASIAYSTVTAATSHLVVTSLTPETTHYWRVRAANPCGTGSDSATGSFSTLAVPEILLVDDDDNGPDVLADYTATLNTLGRDFDVWNTNNTDDEPTIAALAPYSTVIWFTGDEYGGSSGPGGGGEQALAAWLDDSACLLISSQDYFYDRGLTGLMTSHLGLSSATSDVGQTTVDGLATYTGQGPYAFAFPYTNYTDSMIADATAFDAFTGDQGIAGIEKDTGVYRTSFWSFGLEALPTAADRETALAAFLGWCDALALLDGDADGTTNADDCAPGDATVWNDPTPAQALTLTESALDNLTWSAPVSPGATSVTYDLLRSGDPGDFMSGVCMDSGTATTATDAAVPAPGAVWYYLIRVENSCGANIGSASRQAAACP
jgi:choice-of-anchor B domain-containing protein